MSSPLEIATALGYTPGPLEWPTTSIPPLPVSLFGKDHWSTLAYVETRIVDHRGRLEHDHMRCDPDRHPLWYNAGRRGRLFGGLPATKYPTRLIGGVEQPDHDDYDCLDDLVEAGMLIVTMPPAPRGALVTGMIEKELALNAVWSLTDYGQTVAAALRAHLGHHNRSAGFVPPERPS